MSPLRKRIEDLADEMEAHIDYPLDEVDDVVNNVLAACAEKVRGLLDAWDGWRDPPSGWYTFGTHAGWDTGTVPPLQFSEEVGEDGLPLFERPAVRSHDHGPAEGPGLSCPEKRVNGHMVGACLR